MGERSEKGRFEVPSEPLKLLAGSGSSGGFTGLLLTGEGWAYAAVWVAIFGSLGCDWSFWPMPRWGAYTVAKVADFWRPHHSYASTPVLDWTGHVVAPSHMPLH